VEISTFSMQSIIFEICVTKIRLRVWCLLVVFYSVNNRPRETASHSVNELSVIRGLKFLWEC